MMRKAVVKEGMKLKYVTGDPLNELEGQIVTAHKGQSGWYVLWPCGTRSTQNGSGITDDGLSECWETIDEVVTSASHYTSNQLKIVNTKQEATHCAACGALLKKPFVGRDSFKYKHCPMCEP
jgi:hypothetical protein